MFVASTALLSTTQDNSSVVALGLLHMLPVASAILVEGLRPTSNVVRGPYYSQGEPQLYHSPGPLEVTLVRIFSTFHPFPREGVNLVSPTRVVAPPPMASRREPPRLPRRVLNTFSEARAPSTRRFYMQKWAIFSGWFAAQLIDPVSCEIATILSFLQELLDDGHTPYTLKVYIIALYHAPIAGQSIGKHDLMVRFLRGAGG